MRMMKEKVVNISIPRQPWSSFISKPASQFTRQGNKNIDKHVFIVLQDFAFLQQFVNCFPHLSSSTVTVPQSSRSRPARTPNSQHVQHIYRKIKILRNLRLE